jgi:putative membrane protein
MIDLSLAILHHLLVFGIVVMLASELALVRPGMSGAQAVRVAKTDAGYGISAVLILVVGVIRLNFGAKGSEWYEANLWFWAKMAAFALVGALSVPPTLAFMRWRKAVDADPSFAPPQAEIDRARRWLVLEVALLGLIFVFAAAMARHQGFGG